MSGETVFVEAGVALREPPESTGLHGQNLGTHGVDGTPGRPLSLAWITDDLVAYTREVWAGHLGRPVPEEEAIEMLVNVKRLAEAMLMAAEKEETSR